MPLELNEKLKAYVTQNHEKMCKDLAIYFLSNGLMCRLHDIVEGKKELRYLPISQDAPIEVLEVDGSLIPYAPEYGSKKFHLARYRNGGLGIVDLERKRFYVWNPENDGNLKWAQEFFNLMEKKNLDSGDRVFLFIMHALTPLFEWSSATSHRMFKSLQNIANKNFR